MKMMATMLLIKICFTEVLNYEPKILPDLSVGLS